MRYRRYCGRSRAAALAVVTRRCCRLVRRSARRPAGVAPRPCWASLLTGLLPRQRRRQGLVKVLARNLRAAEVQIPLMFEGSPRILARTVWCAWHASTAAGMQTGGLTAVRRRSCSPHCSARLNIKNACSPVPIGRRPRSCAALRSLCTHGHGRFDAVLGCQRLAGCFARTRRNAPDSVRTRCCNDVARLPVLLRGQRRSAAHIAEECARLALVEADLRSTSVRRRRLKRTPAAARFPVRRVRCSRLGSHAAERPAGASLESSGAAKSHQLPGARAQHARPQAPQAAAHACRAGVKVAMQRARAAGSRVRTPPYRPLAVCPILCTYSQHLAHPRAVHCAPDREL